jgi:hypothetical protein
MKFPLKNSYAEDSRIMMAAKLCNGVGDFCTCYAVGNANSCPGSKPTLNTNLYLHIYCTQKSSRSEVRAIMIYVPVIRHEEVSTARCATHVMCESDIGLWKALLHQSIS